MDFEQLTAEYIDDYIAEAMYARELEWFQYNFDKQNFLHMLESMPASAARESLVARIKDIDVQMAVVEQVYTALKAQIRNTAAHTDAIARVAAKRLG